MALYNLCRCCGHRLSGTLRQCMDCGSLRNTNRNKQILSGVFVLAAILLILDGARGGRPRAGTFGKIEQESVLAPLNQRHYGTLQPMPLLRTPFVRHTPAMHGLRLVEKHEPQQTNFERGVCAGGDTAAYFRG